MLLPILEVATSRLEYAMSRIAYLGPPGTFSHEVTLRLFPNEQLIPFEWIAEVVDAIELGQVDASIVPWLQSATGRTGTIQKMFEAFGNTTTFVSGIVDHPVEMCLLTRAGSLNDIAEVASAQTAIDQSSIWLQQKLQKDVRLTDAGSTAKGAELAEANHSLAALGSAALIALYPSLKVLQRGVQNDKNNRTWFATLTQSIAHRESHQYCILKTKSVNLTDADLAGLVPDGAIATSWIVPPFLYYEFHACASQTWVKDLMAYLRVRGHDLDVAGCYDNYNQPFE